MCKTILLYRHTHVYHLGLDTDIFKGHGHSQFFISRTRSCSYEVCPQTDTETTTPNFSYDGLGHFRLRVSQYGQGHGQGHVAHNVFLYGHGHVSLFRVRDLRTFTKFTTFTYRNSLLPLAKRRIQFGVKSSTVVPNHSNSLARPCVTSACR